MGPPGTPEETANAFEIHHSEMMKQRSNIWQIFSGREGFKQKYSSHLKDPILIFFVESLHPCLTDEIIVNLQDSGQEDTRQWAHTFATLVAYLKSLPEMDFWDNFFHEAAFAFLWRTEA